MRVSPDWRQNIACRPAIGAHRVCAEAGLLTSYGPHYSSSYQRRACYVDRIFKGATPSGLPVEQPTRFELFINGKTARAPGRTILHCLLGIAEQVIE